MELEYLAGGLALVSGSLVVERVEVPLGDPVGGYEDRDGPTSGDHESDVLAFGLQDLGGGPGSVIAVFRVDGRDEFAGIFTGRESRVDVPEGDAAFAADECVPDEVRFEIDGLVFEDVISGVSQGGFGCPDGVGGVGFTGDGSLAGKCGVEDRALLAAEHRRALQVHGPYHVRGPAGFRFAGGQRSALARLGSAAAGGLLDLFGLFFDKFGPRRVGFPVFLGVADDLRSVVLSGARW